MILQCDKKMGGCGMSMEIQDIESTKKDKWMECCYCGRMFLNPFYEE